MTVMMREAIFERDTATFMSMDPYFVINWKEQKIKSEPAYGGGKAPKWNEAHQFEVGTDASSMGVMTFSFFDDNNIICSMEF